MLNMLVYLRDGCALTIERDATLRWKLYTKTGPTSPSVDPKTGTWYGSCRSTIFLRVGTVVSSQQSFFWNVAAKYCPF